MSAVAQAYDGLIHLESEITSAPYWNPPVAVPAPYRSSPVLGSPKGTAHREKFA